MRKRILTLVLALVAFTASAQDTQPSEISITARIRTYVLEAPRANAELVGILQSGAEISALGRDPDASWLRILDGWVLAEVFRASGDMTQLPDATHSVNVTVSSAAQLYDGPSTKWFSATGELTAGSKAVALGRNESGSWLRLPQGWIEVAHVEAAGDIRPLPVAPSGVIITAKARTFILAEPDLSAEFVDVFEADEEALAIGRAGDWLQIARGWVSAEAIDTRGIANELPFTGDGIVIVARRTGRIRTAPYAAGESVAVVGDGTQLKAIGRTDDGVWLNIDRGWVLGGSYAVSGNVMDLPVTWVSDDSNAPVSSRSMASSRATATPRPSSWTVSTIRSLVSRHTDDIRILDLDISSSAATIEYDLKPWPFVPNESIANEVAFKIICALRRGQQIPSTLKLIGQGHFKSDIGRKFKAPSVEIHISARRANSLICAGNDHSDISWRSVSSLYKSYPIPRGASVDYD